jgi:hypothetical protein
MHSHTPDEDIAITDDLVLESLGYKPGMTGHPVLTFCNARAN